MDLPAGSFVMINWIDTSTFVCQQVAGGILMSADAVSKRMTDHSAKVQSSSEPGLARPLPGAVKASATMTRAGTKVLSKTAGKVGLADSPHAV
jgi:hypothetical protein